MCDRAGIGALWVEDLAEEPGAGVAPEPPGGAGRGVGGGARVDAWTALALLAGEVRRARVGAVLDAAAWPPGRLARMAATLGALTGGRLELTLRAGAPRAAAAVRALRAALAATTVPAALAPAAGGAPAGPPVLLAAPGPAYDSAALPAEVPTIAVQLQPPAGADAGTGEAQGTRGAGEAGADRGPGSAAAGRSAGEAEVGSGAGEAGADRGPGGQGPVGALGEALALVDDLVLPTAPLAATLAAAAATRQAALRAGRGPATLGVAARLPVSVGRTSAEAQARWEAEPSFAALGSFEEAGLFGTLEQCHDRVVALAHAGVSDLRCLLPNAIDIHDVIAQLTAMTIGSVDKLVPGAPRTRVPEPPAGWGGRSRFPRPS
jgi:alkanesulfonate monooxygenase SsuD/methylene tetrahydromethanopterin reductase-like flavin-dependent oxidoreductase (luciferase family)